MVRPRGWHLPEKHVLVDGKPAPGRALRLRRSSSSTTRRRCSRRAPARTSTCPKLESHLEARLWNDVFVPRAGAARHPARHDQGDGAHRDAPRRVRDGRDPLRAARALRGPQLRPLGLHLLASSRSSAPTRGTSCPTARRSRWTRAFLRAYAQLLIQTCHRRGVHAMGGMAAQIPIKDDPAANEAALAKVRADKLREVTDGHDGTWVAHPGLVPIAKAIFDEHMKTPNQLDRKREDVHVTARDLLRVAGGHAHRGGPAPQHPRRRPVPRGVAARHRLRAALQPDGGRRDGGDLRAHRWQWIHHGATLDDGTAADRRALPHASSPRRWSGSGSRSATPRFQGGRFEEARALFERLSTQARVRRVPHPPRLRAARGRGRGAGAHPGRRDGRRAASPPLPRTPIPARWDGIVRPYTQADVERLRGSVQIEHTLAQLGAKRLWELLHAEPYVHALGALTGNQAVQKVKAGLKAIYLSGWQVAADANTAGQMYPDQSLYPANSRARRSSGASTRRCSAPTRSSTPRARSGTLLVRADRRRRRGRLRRPAQRLRADEGDDRGGRRGRALRGPARVARRSAATWAARCSSRPASSSARSPPRGSPPTCWACRRSSSRAPTRTARSSSRATSTRATRRSSDGRAHRRGLLPDAGPASRRPSRAASPTRRTPT